MNLMEIGKKPEIQPTETADQMKNLPDTTDKWKQLAKEQAASLELVTEERDELQVRNQKMNEFIQKFQERTHKLKMEKQKLFFENHEMQDEIHRLTIELSEKQKLNQSLQQSNDDLRNRNGLKSRSEQEQLEEEIKDVRDQNSKLQIQVNKSSVQAVDEAYRKQKEAENGQFHPLPLYILLPEYMISDCDSLHTGRHTSEMSCRSNGGLTIDSRLCCLHTACLRTTGQNR